MKLSDVIRPVFFVAREGVELGKNDPALALRTSATGLQSLLMDGVGDTVQKSTAQAVVPVIRVALLGADAVQCYRTFKRLDATSIDRTMDAIRVATDMVGAVGGVLMAFMPPYAQLGSALVGTAYAADLVSHAYRGITHVEKRMKVWESEMQPPDPPAPPPSQTPPGNEPPKTAA
ncbi:MAG: hypothetical protein HY319_15275 [Armatimonadetes bacterium]|nr:hypothetical protein [Armatimonadota bacterium]